VHRGKLASLLHADELVCGNIMQLIGCAAWPADFYQVDHRLVTQPKVQAEVVLGQVAAATTHLVDLRECACDAANASSDGASIGAGAD
jgi:hypothetical protein